MVDAVSSEIVAQGASLPVAKKDKTEAAPTKPLLKASHPSTSNMVILAIKNLSERGGSSLHAIKKYIAANYEIDAEKSSRFIKKYLKSAVIDGKLIQTKGKGATGSFKLSAAASKESAPKKKAAAPKKAKSTSEKIPKAKKVASPAKKTKPDAKSGEKKKTIAQEKVAKVPKEKSTKPTTAAKKLKSPKPKKAVASTKKTAAPKKVTAAKKK